MVNPFRRWFGGSKDGRQWPAVAGWADAQGHRFARSRDGEGFVVETTGAGDGWRLEWGPPQRHYFSGPELRLRADVGPTGDLQMLVMSRELMVLLEQQVFDESTDGTETRMDDDLPEEMRWLVLYPKLTRAELGTLRERFGALSNFPGAARSWLDDQLLRQLDALAAWHPDEQAIALIVNRGRLTLRCPVVAPSPLVIEGALGLFATALTAARRVGRELNDGRFNIDRPDSAPPLPSMPDA